jgi:hypothetical protein
MKPVSITPDQTVAQVLEKYPETIHVWIALKTNCAGCYLVRFCSLEYVAESHKMELSMFLDELKKAIYQFEQGK